MKDNRDMYYPGAGAMPPMGQMGPGMGMPGMGGMPGSGMMPGMQGMPGTGMMPNVSQLESRISSLERQVKRLDARVSRLETPYPTTNATPQASFQTTETHEFTYPYQTSMQVM